MSGSDRNGPSKAELAAALLFAAAFVFLLAFYGLSEERRYDQVASQRTAQYARDADDKLRQSCVGLIPKDQQACLVKNGSEAKLQKQDNERNELDLVAQRKSALWTGIMGLAALIGMGLSAIGVWLIWTTFREAKRTANAALNANKIAENAQRAWIKFTIEPDWLLLYETKYTLSATITLENIGQTPAQNVRVGSTASIQSDARDINNPANREPPNGIIKHAILPTDRISDQELTFGQLPEAQDPDSPMRFYLIVTVLYDLPNGEVGETTRSFHLGHRWHDNDQDVRPITRRKVDRPISMSESVTDLRMIPGLYGVVR